MRSASAVENPGSRAISAAEALFTPARLPKRSISRLRHDGWRWQLVVLNWSPESLGDPGLA